MPSPRQAPSVPLAAPAPWRNLVILTLAGALGVSISSINTGGAGLTGRALLSADGADTALATLPVSALVIGTAIMSWPAALIYARFGRKKGALLGMTPVLLGGTLCGLATLSGIFWLLCLGALINGLSAAFVHQYRFAAAEYAPEPQRARAISLVMAGSVFAGFLGPQALVFADLLAPGSHLAPAFFIQAAYGLAALIALSRLDKTPPAYTMTTQTDSDARLRPGLAATAMLFAATAFAVMVFIMTAAPLAMVHGHGHSNADSALGIQWHVIAMFAPGFITGSLIQRFGQLPITTLGLLLLVLSCLTGLTQAKPCSFNDWPLLVALGVGWNFAYIGATHLLSSTCQGPKRAILLGANDFIIFTLVAIASLSAGLVFDRLGWENLLNLALVAIAPSLMLALALGCARAFGRVASQKKLTPLWQTNPDA